MLAFAGGATNIAFAFAGIVYVCIGLAYTELAAAYPVAGGGQFFVTRALGDFVGFIAGWAVLLDFTIDIAIFAWFAIGYISFLVPWLRFDNHPIEYFASVLSIAIFLTVLNVVGVKQSSRLNEVVSAIDVCTESVILVSGFILVWHPETLVHIMQTYWPTTDNFMKGVSLAIISFVGLESISHAAEETQRPSTVMPRTSVALILTILIFALSYSNLVLGMPDILGHPMFQVVADAKDNAIATLASHIPILGGLFALYIPVIGAMLVIISSNSGVFGASRIAYSMGQYQLLPSWFQVNHAKTKTPINSIMVFSCIAVLELILAFVQGNRALDFLADLYAFGAALSYTLVFVALIVLRFTDSAAPRRFKMPLNIPMKFGKYKGDVSLVSLVGLLGIFLILVFTLITHVYGRIAGPSWVILGILFFAIYRSRKNAPVFGSVPRDWEKLHQKTLTSAGELEMLDEYQAALAAQKKDASGTT